jgi:hypothetical protein
MAYFYQNVCSLRKWKSGFNRFGRVHFAFGGEAGASWTVSCRTEIDPLCPAFRSGRGTAESSSTPKKPEPDANERSHATVMAQRRHYALCLVHGGNSFRNLIAEQASKLGQMCSEAGRSFNSLEITVLLQAAKNAAEARKQIEQYQSAGATRLLFLLTPIPPGQPPQLIAQIAETYSR